MSQHDFDITNADANTGLTMRAAINAALQALASNNSGASDPSITYPYQFKVDTSVSPNLVYIRNGANSAWVRWAYIDAASGLLLPDKAADANLLQGKTLSTTPSAGNIPMLSSDGRLPQMLQGIYGLIWVKSNQQSFAAWETNLLSYNIENWDAIGCTSTVGNTIQLPNVNALYSITSAVCWDIPFLGGGTMKHEILINDSTFIVDEKYHSSGNLIDSSCISVMWPVVANATVKVRLTNNTDTARNTGLAFYPKIMIQQMATYV